MLHSVRVSRLIILNHRTASQILGVIRSECCSSSQTRSVFTSSSHRPTKLSHGSLFTNYYVSPCCYMSFKRDIDAIKLSVPTYGQDDSTKKNPVIVERPLIIRAFSKSWGIISATPQFIMKVLSTINL